MNLKQKNCISTHSSKSQKSTNTTRGIGTIMNNSRSELLENGYTLRKNAVSAENISSLAALAAAHSKLGGIHKHHGIRQPHAFRKASFITRIFEEKALIQSITDCMGTNDWFITNHADLHSNALSGWHKDDGMTYGNGGYFNRPAYDLKDPKVFKVAVYFQDHVDFNDGLTIVPGSHLSEIIYESSDNALHLNTQAGDVLIFDPRLSHTGQVEPIPQPLTPAGEKILTSLESKILTIKEKTLTALEKQSELLILFRSTVGYRSSIFFTVAVESEDSNIFAIKNMERQIDELGSDTSPFLPTSVSETLKDLGINTIDSRDFWQDRFGSNPTEILCGTSEKISTTEEFFSLSKFNVAYFLAPLLEKAPIKTKLKTLARRLQKLSTRLLQRLIN